MGLATAQKLSDVCLWFCVAPTPRPPCRWCATGTPASGDITDLIGQFKVLNLQPFSDETFFSVFVRSAYSGSMQTCGTAHLLLCILGRCMIRHTKLQVVPA